MIDKGLKKDVLLSLSAQVAVMLVAFALNKIVSNFLGVEGFAEYNISRRSGVLISPIILMGMGTALPRYLSFYLAKGRNSIAQALLPITLLLLSLSMVIMLLLLIIAPSFWGRLLLGSLFSCELLFAAFIYAIALSFNGIVVSFYQGKGDFNSYNVFQIVSQLLLIVGVFLMNQSISRLLNIWSIMLFVVSFGVLAKYIHLETFCSRPLSFKLKISVKLLLYGLPRGGTDVVTLLADYIPLMIILNKFNQHGVGLYSAALSIQLMVTPIFAFSGGVFLQRVSMLAANKQYRDINKLINKTLLLFLGVALLSIALLSSMPQFLLTLLFSKSFLEGAPLVVIVSLSILPRSFFLSLRNPLDALSNKPYTLLIVIVWLSVYLLGIFFADSIQECGWMYTISSCTLGVMSYAIYRLVLNNKLKKYA